MAVAVTLEVASDGRQVIKISAGTPHLYMGTVPDELLILEAEKLARHINDLVKEARRNEAAKVKPFWM